MDAELVGMSFSDAENRAYYVPVPAEREKVLKIVNEFRPPLRKREIHEGGTKYQSTI